MPSDHKWTLIDNRCKHVPLDSDTRITGCVNCGNPIEATGVKDAVPTGPPDSDAALRNDVRWALSTLRVIENPVDAVREAKERLESVLNAPAAAVCDVLPMDVAVELIAAYFTSALPDRTDEKFRPHLERMIEVFPAAMEEWREAKFEAAGGENA